MDVKEKEEEHSKSNKDISNYKDKIDNKDNTNEDKITKSKSKEEKKTTKKKAQPKFNILPDDTKFSDKDRALDITKVFVERSNVCNDELIKYFLINNKIKNYVCEIERCPTKNGLWRRQPCYLELVRKNCKPRDLRINNIIFMCPNCYCQEKGPENFKIIKQKIEHKCICCNYILTKRNKSGICFVCTQKINKGITNSYFTSVRETAELTAKTNNNNNYHIEDYTDEMETEKYEKIIKGTNEIKFTNNILPNKVDDNVGKTLSTSSKFGKSKNHKSKNTNNIITQTEYSLEISSDLLAELDNV